MEKKESVLQSDILFKKTIGKIMNFLEATNNHALKKMIKLEIWNLSDDLKSQDLLIDKKGSHDRNKNTC